MERLLLTPLETAQVMGIGRTKVYELMKDGSIESVHIGECRRIPLAAVEAFIERLRRPQQEP